MTPRPQNERVGEWKLLFRVIINHHPLHAVDTNHTMSVAPTSGKNPESIHSKIVHHSHSYLQNTMQNTSTG